MRNFAIMADQDIQQAEEKILENVSSNVQSYEVDGEKVVNKDALKQLDALDRIRAHRASRNPLGAIRFLRFPGSLGTR